jgi:lysophospholipase L1-like esterase
MAQDIRICFVGDSFVNGTGDETALGWAGRLCAAANDRGMAITYYNLGIRRDTSRDILLRWEHECALRLPADCDGRIVFACGVNDTVIEGGALRVHPEESRANIREFLRGAKRYRVLVVGPPPVADNDQNERIHGLSQTFAHEASALGIPYIELFSPLKSDSLYKQDISLNDGFHPSSIGYATMAQIIGTSTNWWFYAP